VCSSGKYLNLLRCVRALAAGWQRRVSVVVLCHNCLLGSLWLADVEGGEGREKMQIISTTLTCCRSWCEPRHSSLISCCSPPPSPPSCTSAACPGGTYQPVQLNLEGVGSCLCKACVVRLHYASAWMVAAHLYLHFCVAQVACTHSLIVLCQPACVHGAVLCILARPLTRPLTRPRPSLRPWYLQ